MDQDKFAHDAALHFLARVNHLEVFVAGKIAVRPPPEGESILLS
jgi:hypothetical protein